MPLRDGRDEKEFVAMVCGLCGDAYLAQGGGQEQQGLKEMDNVRKELMAANDAIRESILLRCCL